MGSKFIVYGGTGAEVYNDIRSINSTTYEWTIMRPNLELHDFPGGFGHSMNVFERYLVVFGGSGSFQHKLKKRNIYQDVFMYDTQTGSYVKFDGGPASLASELEEIAKRTLRAQKEGHSMEEPGDTDVMKSRIITVSTDPKVNVQSQDQEVRNEFRSKAVVEAAQARTYHVGAVFGPGLFIHGG